MKLENLDIVINCLGMPFNGDTEKTGTIGGSESAAYYVAKELASRGNHITLFTTSQDEGVFDGVTYIWAGDQTEASPLGTQFHFYAENTPHDICIIQRHKDAFAFQWASKLNFLWLHDLALHRFKKDVNRSALNIDGFLVVSEYHKKQVCGVYDIPENSVHVLPNGVDAEQIAAAEPALITDHKGKRLFYMSRPERGLEHLLKAGGIMEQLPDYHLFFCTYNNVAEQMREYYEMLWRKAEAMPNCHNLGFLTKDELYGYMKAMDLLVYPTPGDIMPDFREVSCIAMMEAMHCGLPVLTTNKGALPETCEGAGTWFDSIANFPDQIKTITEDTTLSSRLAGQQSANAPKFSWAKSVDSLEEIVTKCVGITGRQTGAESVGRHLIRHSAISNLVSPGGIGGLGAVADLNEGSQIAQGILKEIEECYKFFPLDSYADHYVAYYEYEAERGVDYGPENLDGNTRFETVAARVAELPEGSTVLDYGCAHGHYTINLAKRFPEMCFIGVDIAQSNINKASKWADSEGIENVEFCCAEYSPKEGTFIGDGFEYFLSQVGYDAIICAEVLEHVRDPHELVGGLLNISDEVTMIMTTPFGPWEAIGYNQHWPWRAHVHNFTLPTIKAMFGHNPEFNVNCVPSGKTPQGEPIGSYVYSFKKKVGHKYSIPSIYELPDESLSSCGVEQTVSLCMIVKDDWLSLGRCLDSVKTLVSEVVVIFDKTGDNRTAKSLLDGFSHDNHIPVLYQDGDSPMELGFDEARNRAIELTCGDWVLWLDSDEEFSDADAMHKYLRSNIYDAYSVLQNHFSTTPAGVIKTDYPAKFFRKSSGIKFFGRIHEHPELALNEGVGAVAILPDVSIAHYGYGDEPTRRDRFKRNFNLLKRDRADYPERQMGIFFWLRDMSQYCQFAAEQGATLEDFQGELDEGIKVWADVMEQNQLRMIMEGVKFYSTLVQLSGRPFVSIRQSLTISLQGGENTDEIDCLFFNADEAMEFLVKINQLRLGSIPTEYI